MPSTLPESTTVPRSSQEERLTLAEVAKLMKVCVKTLNKDVKAGRLRYTLVRARKRFTWADIEEYERAQRELQECRSSVSKTRRTSNLISSGNVIGFAALRKQRIEQKLKDMKTRN